MDLFMNPPAASASAPRKVRSACNRCHSQKLRCVRMTGQDSCERCYKLKTSCRFGPRASRASLKPREQATSYVHEASIPMPIVHSDQMVAGMSNSDWLVSPNTETGIAEEQATPDPNLCDYANMQDTYSPGILCQSSDVNLLDHDHLDFTSINENVTSHASNLPSHGISGSHISEDYDTRDRFASAVRELARLNIALYECATKLPSMARAGVSSASNGEHASRKSTLFIIDELFRLTTEFMDALNSLSLVDCESFMDPKQPGDQSAHLLATYSQHLSSITKTSMGQPFRSFSQVDEATMFMVVSCHCHLTEMYVSIFQMMQACIEHSLVPQIGKNWGVILPRLQVGSIVSPPVQVDVDNPISSAAASSMYMLMITMLSSQLWEQMADVMKPKGDVPTGFPSASRAVLADTVWDTVMDRTDRLSQTIDATKHLLQRYSPVAV